MQHKILIVEDEEIIRLGLQDNFELENYIVETAADGEEAVAKALSKLPQAGVPTSSLSLKQALTTSS